MQITNSKEILLNIIKNYKYESKYADLELCYKKEYAISTLSLSLCVSLCMCPYIRMKKLQTPYNRIEDTCNFTFYNRKFELAFELTYNRKLTNSFK